MYFCSMNHQYINVGKITGTFGLEGQVVLQHALGHKTDLEGLEVVMIELRKNDLVPYFVTETKAKNDGEVYLGFEDLSSKEKAQRVVSKHVWLKREDYQKYVAQTSVLSFLGFLVYDGDMEVGEITEVIEQPHQLLVNVDYAGKDVLIPLHETFIVTINRMQNKLMLNLPEGLLDL